MILIVILALLLAAPVAAAPDYPRLCLYDPQPEMIYSADHRLDAREIAECGRYDLLCSVHHAALARQIRAAWPGVRILQNLTFGGARPQPLETWQLPDTAWGIEELTTWTAHKNPQWWYYRTDGSYVPLIWGRRYLNITSACPPGTRVSGQGLTYAQWCQRRIPQLLRSEAFTSAYNGVILDTWPCVDGWDPNWRWIDYDSDGEPDDHYGSLYGWDAIWARQPWEWEKYNAMSGIFAAWRHALPRPSVFMLSGDWPMSYNGRRLDGPKSEHWGLQPPLSPEFRDWWDGRDQRVGITETLERFVGPDSTLLCIVHAVMPDSWPAVRQAQWARVVTAVSMMTDYTYAAVCVGHPDGSRTLYVPPEWAAWRCDYPLGPAAWSGTRLHRAFKASGRTVVVWLETAGPPETWRAWLAR